MPESSILIVKDYADIQSEIAQTDVLIVATGAQQPTISKELLYLKKPLLILDLSIPKNVSEDVKEHDMVTLVHLDELSSVTNQTLQQRAEQIPVANKIIDEVKAEFTTWVQNRQFIPTVIALKTKLSEIKAGEIDYHRKKLQDFNEEQAEIISDRLIQKITTQVVNHLKQANGSTDQHVTMLEKMFQLENQERE